MRFSQLPRSIRQLGTHVLAVILGVVLTVGTLQVSPSQADPAPKPVTNDTPQLIAQKQSPSTAAIGNSSFVTAAVNRVGAAVVRIDTERTVTRRLPEFYDDPFFRRFFGESFPPTITPGTITRFGFWFHY